jgi:hypothetical protein
MDKGLGLLCLMPLSDTTWPSNGTQMGVVCMENVTLLACKAHLVASPNEQ